MKTCKNCGTQMNDSDMICPVCGVANDGVIPFNQPNFPPVMNAVQPQPQKKNNSVIIAIIVAVTVVVIALIFAVVFVINSNNKNDDTAPNIQQSTELTTETTTEPTTVTTTEEKKETTQQAANVYNYYYGSDGGAHYDNDYDYDYGDWDYLFPSDTELLTTSFLNTKSKGEIDLIRNEIYARHGYIFKKEKYRNYFSQKAWYHPTESSMEVAESHFNSTERKNIAILVDYQGL